MIAIEAGDLATWVSALVAVGSAVYAGMSSRGAERHQREAAQHQREAAQHQENAARLAQQNAEILAGQHKLQLRSWTDQYFKDVRAWGDEVCRAISVALHLSEFTSLDNQEQQRFQVLSQLSALIDTGRWFFPNQWTQDYGTHKAAAYRGLRQPILNCVVKAYRLVREISSSCDEDLKIELANCQRSFVSEIQLILDPVNREEEIKRVLREFKESERLRAGPREPGQALS